jgi:hypothetical protein
VNPGEFIFPVQPPKELGCLFTILDELGLVVEQVGHLDLFEQVLDHYFLIIAIGELDAL